MAGRIICFGEVLLRLSGPGREPLLQSPRFDVCVGGAEANVAVSLARLGAESVIVTVLPDNALGRAARDELRRHGVDTAGVQWGDGRMGLYFLAAGALLRPSEVLYDRAGSAFALAAPEGIDWPPLLAGAARLHLSGITPALGPGPTAAAFHAVRAARDAGVPISFDGNYRAKLWTQWEGDSWSILRELLAFCDIAFLDERDLALALSRPGRPESPDSFERLASAALEAFPALDLVACIQRGQDSVDHHRLTAAGVSREGGVRTRSYELAGVVDRIGAGDAFVAAVLRRLGQAASPREAIEFGLAAAVLKHSIPGDFNLVSEADVESLMIDQGLHVRR